MKYLIKLITVSLILIANIETSFAQKVKGENYNLLVGTYTSSGKSEGIYVYDFNVNTAASAYKSKATGISNPSYLAISKDKKKRVFSKRSRAWQWKHQCI